MLDQDNNFYLISLNVSITCLPDMCMDILGRSFMLLLGVKGSNTFNVSWKFNRVTTKKEVVKIWLKEVYPSCKIVCEREVGMKKTSWKYWQKWGKKNLLSQGERVSFLSGVAQCD